MTANGGTTGRKTATIRTTHGTPLVEPLTGSKPNENTPCGRRSCPTPLQL